MFQILGYMVILAYIVICSNILQSSFNKQVAQL